MIDVVKITQTKAFARQDGAILGAVWIASFASTMWSVTPGYALLSLLANILAISTPFVVAKRLKAFRDDALDGSISFRRGLFYCAQTFFNATLLLTIVQFLWFKFLDTGVFMSYIIDNYTLMLKTYNFPANEIKTLIEAISMMKPISWAAAFMITDIFAAIILSPAIAVLMSRKQKNKLQTKNKNGHNSCCTSI